MHTPGPWTASSHGTITAPALPQHQVPTRNVVVAEVFSGGPGIAESTANARLIEAAPDLLEALRGLLDMPEYDYTQATSCRRLAAKRAARAALDKAAPASLRSKETHHARTA